MDGGHDIIRPILEGRIKIMKGCNSVNTGDGVMVLAFCNAPHGPLSVYQVSFNSLVHSQRSAPGKLFILKIKKGSIPVNIVDMVISYILIFSEGPLSMYEVSFNFLVYVQRYAPDKLFIAKMKKGSNSVNTVDRIMILALCTSTDDPLSMYGVSFNPLYTFRDMLRTNFLLQKWKRGVSP